MVSLKFVDKLPKPIEKIMEKDLVEYEKSHGIDVNYKQYSLVLNDDKNSILGVLNAYTAFAEIYIDDIWVHSSHRRKGYGKKLIEYLENHFKTRDSTI